MLYVFYVGAGTFFTFEEQLYVAPVAKLKSEIERQLGIPAHGQVLIVSGGHHLDDQERVCSFGCGTDTNPVYLYNKDYVENLPSRRYAGLTPKVDINKEVQDSAKWPETYDAVVSRAKLAKQIFETDQAILEECMVLCNDQHHQQLGWSAVTASLQDSLAAFHNKYENYCAVMKEYHRLRDTYRNEVENFAKIIPLLKKIPILPSLLQEPESSFNVRALTEVPSEDETADNDSKLSGSSLDSESENEEVDDTPERITLFDWTIRILTKNEPLDNLSFLAQTSMHQLDTFNQDEWDEDVKEITNQRMIADLLKIIGMSNRLSSLNGLQEKAKALVEEQKIIAQSVAKNQATASNIGDTSVIPELCASHKRCLMSMNSNHQKIVEIQSMFLIAKNELCKLIRTKFLRVFDKENQLFERDCRMTLYSETKNSLQRCLTLIEQVQKAPELYVKSVIEVFRRRKFSESYISKCTDAHCSLMSYYSDEAAIRSDFLDDFKDHYLDGLFPGMGEYPPISVVAEPPPNSDGNLPVISNEDFKILLETVPELMCEFPDIMQLPGYHSKLLQITETAHEEKRKAIENVSSVQQTDSQMSTTSINLAQNVLKESERELESETDTEEFENVGQSPADSKLFKKVPVPIKPKEQDASTLTEDNLYTSEAEIERLKSLLTQTAQAANQTIQSLRSELQQLKQETNNQNSNFTTQLSHSMTEMMRMCEQIQSDAKENERERIQQLTVDHELEMNDVKKLAIAKDDEIRSLKLEKIDLECSFHRKMEQESMKLTELNMKYNECVTEMEKLQTQLEEQRTEHDKIVQNLRQTLTREHQNELESLRARFRLMTVLKMERSPSDTSLERIDKVDVIDDAVLNDIKETAVKSAIEQEQNKWKELMDAKELEWTERNKQLELKCQQDIRDCEAKWREIVQQNQDDQKKRNEMDVKQKIETEKQRWKSLMSNLEHEWSQTVQKEVLKVQLHYDELLALKEKSHREELARKLDEEMDSCKKSLEDVENKFKVQIESARLKIDEEIMFTEQLRKIIDDKEKEISGLVTSRSLLEEKLEKLKRENMAAKSNDPNVTDVTCAASEVCREKVSKAKSDLSDASITSIRVYKSTEAAMLETAHTVPYSRPLTHRQLFLMQQYHINMNQCIRGSRVLVVFDKTCKNYLIPVNHEFMHILHPDCVPYLSLPSSEHASSKYHCVGIVTGKECCSARRDGNSYNIPRGTNFYLVRVEPYEPFYKDAKSLATSKSMSRSTNSAVCGMPVSTMIGSLPDPMTNTDRLPSAVAQPSLQLLLQPQQQPQHPSLSILPKNLLSQDQCSALVCDTPPITSQPQKRSPECTPLGHNLATSSSGPCAIARQASWTTSQSNKPGCDIQNPNTLSCSNLDSRVESITGDNAATQSTAISHDNVIVERLTTETDEVDFFRENMISNTEYTLPDTGSTCVDDSPGSIAPTKTDNHSYANDQIDPLQPLHVHDDTHGSLPSHHSPSSDSYTSCMHQSRNCSPTNTNDATLSDNEFKDTLNHFEVPVLALSSKRKIDVLEESFEATAVVECPRLTHDDDSKSKFSKLRVDVEEYLSKNNFSAGLSAPDEDSNFGLKPIESISPTESPNMITSNDTSSLDTLSISSLRTNDLSSLEQCLPVHRRRQSTLSSSFDFSEKMVKSDGSGRVDSGIGDSQSMTGVKLTEVLEGVDCDDAVDSGVEGVGCSQ